jgi:PAS domain-containing protein
MEQKYINIEPTPLSICDMRPGFTEDEVELVLPKGQYCLSTIEIGSLQGFQLLLKESKFDKEEKSGCLSLDGACVGVFDKQGFLNYFNNDFEAIYDWSSEKVLEGKPWGDISHDTAGTALYIQTLSDCTCEVLSLYSNGSIVGFKFLPLKIETNEDQKKEWTWINLKCKGIYQEFSICHDRDYEIELDEAIDNILSDLCTVETEESLNFIDESSIDISAPITSFRSDFNGIETVGVIYEKSFRGNTIRRPIHPNIEKLINNIGDSVTTKELGKCIYEIFKISEKMR